MVRGALALAVFAWTLAVFWPTWSAGFVDWDDELGLLRNPHFRGFGAEQLEWMFSTFHTGHYQPLTWLSFALDHALWGMEPWAYHLQNVLWHGAAAVLFYAVVLRLLGAAAGSTESATPARCGAAALAALLFSVHPLRVESVAWVTERRDVLSACALLATVLIYLRLDTARRDGQPLVGLRIALVVCFALSLLAKAWGMTLPVVLLLLDYYPLRRTRTGATWGQLVREKAPLLVLALAAGWVASRAQLSTGATVGLEIHGIAQRAAQAAYGLCFYVVKTVWPADLSPLYPLPWGFDPLQPVFVLSGLAVLAATGAALWCRRRCPALTVAWFCYVVVVSPVLGVLQTGPQLVADRYSYLSCLSWSVLAAAVWLRASGAADAMRRRALVALAVTAPLVLGGLTMRQCRIWKDTATLWQHALSIEPDHPKALYSLGWFWLDRARVGGDGVDLAAARQALQRAADLLQRPEHGAGAVASWIEADVHVALAWCVLLDEERSGRPNRVRVRQQFEQVASRWPDSARAQAGLGVAAAVSGDLPGARRAFERAVQLDPQDSETRFNLGRLYGQIGHRDLARRQLLEALRLNPQNAAAQRLLDALKM